MLKKLSLLLLLLLAAAPCASASDFVPGDVIVVLRNTSGTTISAAAQSAGSVRALSSVQEFTQSERVNVSRTFDALSETGNNIFMVVHSDTEDSQSLLRRVSANPNVLAASLNRIYHGTSTDRRVPNDSEYYRLWGMEAVKAPQAWNLSTGSSDVYVAVVDSGINYTHPDLAAHFASEHSKNFVGGKNYDETSYYDEVDHGTHIAGTIGAIGNNSFGVAGLNWEVKLISVRVLDANNSGTDEILLAGQNHIAELLRRYPNLNLAAVNYSIGGGWDLTPREIITARDPQYLAFKAISDTNRTLICIAAGNEGTEVGAPHYYGDMSDVEQGRYVYPASFTGIENMIVVAAAEQDLSRAYFSNYSRKFVDIAAPGSEIFSTVVQGLLINLKYDTLSRSYPYGYMSGTSMAAPHVTGTAALLKAMYPSATPSQIKAAIVGGADSTVLCTDGTSMYGLLDIDGAIYGLSRTMESESSPLIAFAYPPEAVVNQPYNFRLYASGSEPITWTLDGRLPAGLIFRDGVIMGTPLSLERSEVLVTAQNDYGSDSWALTISTDKGTPPMIDRSIEPPNIAAGVKYEKYIRLTAGTWPFTWEITNSPDILADGDSVSIDKNGFLRFVPKNAKTYTLTVRVSNFAGEDSVNVIVNVNSGDALPVIEDKTLKRAIAGQSYGACLSSDFPADYNPNPNRMTASDTIAIESATDYTWSADNLPDGMYCSLEGEYLTLSGRPTSADTYNIVITVSNKADTVSKDFLLVVENSAPSFLASQYEMTYARGMNMNLVIPVLGTPEFSLDIAGSLPVSTDFVKGHSTALITGIPAENGVYRSVITAANKFGTARTELVLAVTDPAVITTATLPDALVGEAYTFTFSSLYGANLSWSVSGDVLAGVGLTLSDSGVLSGTPTKAGHYSFTVKAEAKDSPLNSWSTFLLKVEESPSVTSSGSLPSGKVNTVYGPVYIAYGGTGPMWFTLTEGTMPAGLSLTSNGCVLGTPTESGTFTFTVEVQNLAGQASRTFTLSVDPDSTRSPDVLPSPDDGHTDSRRVTQGQTRGVSSLTAGELAQVSGNGRIIAAVLPELTVSGSGMYSSADVDCFGSVVLSSDVPAGYVLVWHPFVRGSDAPANDESAFFTLDGQETGIVPNNHRVNVSAYLEAGKLYAPVISAVPPASGGDPGSSGGGCQSMALGFVLCLPLIAIFRRFH